MSHARSFLIPLLVWGVVSFADGFALTEDKVDPDDVALLQAVEKSRQQTKPFRVKGRISFKSRKGLLFQEDLQVAYEKGKYRIQGKLLAPATGEPTSIFDGVQHLSYDPDDETFRDKTMIVNPTQKPCHLAFDPRVIGISHSLHMDIKLNDCLGFHSATRIELTGAEEAGGAPVKIVTVTEKSGQEIRFWIDPAKPSRVVKYSVVFPIEKGGSGSTTVSESEFWPGNSDEWLPRKVRVVTFETDEETRVVSETVLLLGKPLRPVHIPPDTWTLRGLGLPSDRVVMDPRTMIRIGYWDGEKLTLDLVEKP